MHRRAPALALAVLLAWAGCRASTPAPAADTRPPPAPEGPRCLERGSPGFARTRIPAPPMSHLGAAWLVRPEREQEEAPDRLVEALGLRPGMVVADIGAGVGYHTWRMAPRVAPGGRVLATDLQLEMLRALEENVRARGIDNVVAIRSTEHATGLPARSVDLALMVDVYHELAEPERFLADLRRALRPGGRVAIVEFRAEDPHVPIRPEHKMAAVEVIAELGAAGFCLVERFDELPWQHLLVFAAERG